MLPTLALCGALTLPLLCGFGVRHRYCVHSMSPCSSRNQLRGDLYALCYEMLALAKVCFAGLLYPIMKCSRSFFESPVSCHWTAGRRLTALTPTRKPTAQRNPASSAAKATIATPARPAARAAASSVATSSSKSTVKPTAARKPAAVCYVPAYAQRLPTAAELAAAAAQCAHAGACGDAQAQLQRAGEYAAAAHGEHHTPLQSIPLTPDDLGTIMRHGFPAFLSLCVGMTVRSFGTQSAVNFRNKHKVVSTSNSVWSQASWHVTLQQDRAWCKIR